MDNLLLAITIFVTIYVTAVISARWSENTLLEGFWKADPSFCEQAGLDLFYLYLGKTTMGKRSGYILAWADDKPIINTTADFTFGMSPNFTPQIAQCRQFTVTIDMPESNGYFPDEQTVYYYPALGKLIFEQDSQVYAVLYKDTVISDPLNIVPDHLVEDECAD